MSWKTSPTPDEWELQHLESASRCLFNADTRVRDERRVEGPIPDELFRLVARFVSDALQGHERHDEAPIRFEAHDASADEGGLYIEVSLMTRETPNTLNYAANSLDNVSFMGAALNTSYSTPKKRRRRIPDGWMECRYRFYPPEAGFELKQSTDVHLPKVEFYDPDEVTAPV